MQLTNLMVKYLYIMLLYHIVVYNIYTVLHYISIGEHLII